METTGQLKGKPLEPQSPIQGSNIDDAILDIRSRRLAKNQEQADDLRLQKKGKTISNVVWRPLRSCRETAAATDEDLKNERCL